MLKITLLLARLTYTKYHAQNYITSGKTKLHKIPCSKLHHFWQD